jgi:S-adenosylmethionine:tRNA ribosyltransferase-isomerase
MKTSVENYNFDLPENLIAQYPSDKRGESNLLILNKSTGIIEQKKFADIVDLITEDDFLVINNTKVLKARLFGKKTTGGKVEILLIEDIGNNRFKALTNGKVKIGTEIIIDKYMVKIIDFSNEEGQRIIEFSDINPYELMEKSGHLPLPPYIKREDSKEDELRYQTVYAKNQGSVAAPTAGLHFTKEIIDKIKEKGIEIIEITLNVGIGTFRPVKADFIQEHKMHFEHYSISEESADRINKLKSEGKKLISVGTTTTRALESASDRNGKIIKTGNQSTNIFIYPPYEFKMVDKMVTNFHTPQSTLLMMVSAFSDIKLLKKAYLEAKKNEYRFLSYGDAMIII